MREIQVKIGYKPTETGLIPEDWESTLLKFISLFENGDRGANYPSQNSFVEVGIPFINAGHISEGRIFLDEMDYITLESFNTLGSGKVKTGDILFCLRGSLGKYGVVNPDFGKGAIASSLVIVRAKDSRVDYQFLEYYFASDLCVQMIRKWAGGAAQPNLGARDLSRFAINLPPLPEQRAIAEALSDVDAWISALDKLIIKKRGVKQATMQNLLMGRVRLPGFQKKPDTIVNEVGVIPIEWEVSRLEEVTDIISGGTPSTSVTDYWDGGIPWCIPSDITEVEGKYLLKTTRTISLQGLSNSSATLLPTGTLLLCSRATIGELKISGMPIATNQGFKSLVADPEKVDNEYLYYQVCTLTPYLISKAAGSTFLEISRKDVGDTPLLLPPLPEQRAIAEVLSDMDAEIDKLECRRLKAKAIKQGMMQELLTGHIRLV